MGRAKAVAEEIVEEVIEENDDSEIVQIKLRLVGVGPMLMTSDVSLNPLDPKVLVHNELLSTRPKNKDWHERVAKSNFMLSLTCDKELGPYVPAKTCLRSIVKGGTLHKLGTAAQRAIILLDDKLKLEYKGPRDPEGLYANKKFVDVRGGGRGVPIVRPKFESWSLEFPFVFAPSMLPKDSLILCAKSAGKYMGIGGYRTGGFGRYEVEVLS